VLLGVGVFLTVGHGMAWEGMSEAERAAELAMWAPTPAQLAEQLAALQGSYFDVVAHRAFFVFMAQTMYFLLFFFWRCGGMMLLGMALYKWSFLDGRRSERAYLLAAATGVPIGLALAWYGVMELERVRFGMPERTVVDVWREQFLELGSIPGIQYVQIFENRGAMMGASNPHPHCQIWANAHLPTVPAREQASLTGYRAKHGECMLCRYLAAELEIMERVVCENAGFVALVPFWAIWPFEMMILSRTHLAGVAELDSAGRDLLGDILRRVSIRYDNLFAVPLPNSMGFHQQPTDGLEHPEWHLHLHFFPPLLRSATIRKFSVGYEMLAMPQRDFTPEMAAARLREAGEVHYRGPQAG